MNEAIGKIRAALKGHDLLGAEAIELKPGAVVLVVLRYDATRSPDEVQAIRQNWATMAEALQAEGVRAVACCVPHGFALDVIEVAEAAPSAVDLLIGVYPNGSGAEPRTFTTAEQVREAYGHEIRGPGGEPWNATAAAIDAIAQADMVKP